MVSAKEFMARIIKEKNNHFFSAIRTRRLLEIAKRKKEHKWNGRIYPSSLKSLTMCPKRFIEEDVHIPQDFGIDNKYKMELGKVIHEKYQNTALEEIAEGDYKENLESLDFYIRSMYKTEAKFAPILWKRPRQLSPELEEKLEKTFPEIPGYDEESGISFRTDIVMDINGEIGVLDIKTTSIDPGRWQYHKSDESYILQVRIYRHLLNKHNYYEKPIRYIGLAYINLLMPSGIEGSEFEDWRDLGEEPDKEVELLISHLAIHRNAWFEEERKLLDCKYPKCRVHGEGEE